MPYYGRIDRSGSPVFPSERHLKQLKARNTLLAMNFVVDAFEDMREFIKQSVLTGKISDKKSVYVKIEPFRAWESIHESYHAMFNIHYSQFNQDWITRNLRSHKINGFDSFINEFTGYLVKMVDEFPINRSQFILSKHCSAFMTGLCIDIAKEDSNRDFNKSEIYLKDPNFEYFAKTANKFGFMVDKNAPWRLIADIGSSAMSKYMAKRGFTLENLFERAYYRAYETDISSLKEYMVIAYEQFQKTYEELTYPFRLRDGGVGVRTVKRKKTDKREILAIRDVTWMEHYLKVLTKELKLKNIDTIVKETLKITSVLGIKSAMKHFEKRTGGLKLVAYPETRKQRFK